MATKVSAVRHVWAAVAAGLVLTMTGCGVPAQVPQRDALYRDGEQRYLAMATTMHTVLMGVHEGDWTVPTGGYGAVPIGCSLEGSGDLGYRFSYRREVTLPGMDGETMSAAATAAFRDAGLKGEAAGYGKGDAAEWNLVAEDEALGRVVVTIVPGASRVEVSADTPCAPGNAGELSRMVTDDEARGSDTLTWRSLPATEGPDSVPLFYFPVGSPVYFNEDGSPVEPQPVVTAPPKAPYGG